MELHVFAEARRLRNDARKLRFSSLKRSLISLTIKEYGPPGKLAGA